MIYSGQKTLAQISRPFADKIISRKIRAHSRTTFISVNFVIIRGQSR